MNKEIASETNPDVKEVFKTKSGVKFFSLHQPHAISAERGVAAEESRRYASLCLSKNEMKGLIAEYKKGVNNQDIVYSHSIIQEMEYRLNYICEANSLFDLACLYFFIDGENIRTPSEAFNAKKKELFASDPEVRGFFLPIALNLMRSFSESQETDLVNYLEEMRSQSARISRYIPETIWKNPGNS